MKLIMPGHFGSKVFLFFAVMLFAYPVFGQEQAPFLIDTPTTGILPHTGYDLNFRLFSDGGVRTKLDFGVFKIVNLGFGWELSKVVGASQDVTVGPPTLAIKIRPFEGGMVLPSFAFGYDGQGYFYNKDKGEFLEKERGLYFVFGRELLFPGLEVNAGANISDFKTNIVYGFASASYDLEDKVLVIGEYDNIHCTPENRLNLGLRIFVTEALSIDLAGRDIGASGRTAERIIQVTYVGRF